MINAFSTPPSGFGPGSQPNEDGMELDYLALPSGMRTYSPSIPDCDNPDAMGPAFALLQDVAAACRVCARTGAHASFDLSSIDAANRRLIAETMGHGEVSIKARGVPAIAVQESVFAGVWILNGVDIDQLEVGPIPAVARGRAFKPLAPAIGPLAPRGPGVVNGPAIAAELMDKSANYTEGSEEHVVNLSLLPHTEEDLAWLDEALGKGSVSILSRGYGNCRVEATGQPWVWRVQFFNSMDQLILDTFEVRAVPEVVVAAAEDLDDSARRIEEVLEAIR